MVKFTKMHGLGNDYVYVDCTKEQIREEVELAKKVSNRHFGVGSDGLILIKNSEVADFKMVMYNLDGSQAEMCGNGIRCVGKFVYDKGLTDKTTITVETLAGIKVLELNVENKKVKTVTVDMGKAEITHENLKLEVLDKTFEFTGVSVGNPHVITVVDDVDNFDVDKYGKIVESHEVFPNKTNVEFVEIVDRDTIKMRVYERGSGETLACGTGATATLVACNKNGLVNSEATIKLLGGDLDISLKETGNLFMTGPAVIVFNGELEEEV